MKKIHGFEGKLSLAELSKVSDLIYFDGPFLSHYVHSSGDNYLSYWVDCDESTQRWLVFRVGLIVLQNYLNQKISLYELMKQIDEGFVYLIDVFQDGTKSVPTIVFLKDIPDDYFPEVDSYFDFSLEKESDVAALSISRQCGVFEIHFTGADVKYGNMPFEQYAKCLQKVEELRQSLACSYIKKVTSSKRFKSLTPKAQKDEKEQLGLNTRFEYFYSLAGSVRVLLRPQNLQVSFVSTSADDFAKELIRLFKAGYDIDELKKYAADYGNEALAKFNELLELLKKSKVNIEVSWTNAKFKIHESKSIKENDKQIIIDNLVRSIEKTEELKYQGQFYSLNTRSGQFSFETNDKPALAIRGKFDDAIKDRVHSLSFEQLYEIIIERKIKLGLVNQNRSADTIIDIKKV